VIHQAPKVETQRLDFFVGQYGDYVTLHP